MKYEIISSKLNLPIQINFLKDENIERQFNKYPKLYIALNNGFSLETKGENYLLEKDEIVIVNSNILHSIITKETPVVEVIINSEYFSDYNSSFENTIFDDMPLSQEKYGNTLETLKIKVIEIIRIYNKSSMNNQLLTLNKIIEFADFLIDNFAVEQNNSFGYIYNDNNKIHQIIDFIDKNYNQEVSLKETASVLNINPQYLSRFFKQQAGIGFLNYLNKIRIKKSLKCLLSTNKSILEIAVDYGFNDSKNYTRAFKQEFQMTPGEYRKKIKLENIKTKEQAEPLNKEYFVELISNFVNGDKEENKESSSISNKNNCKKEVSVDKYYQYEKYWSKIMSFERAYTLTRIDVQEQIENSSRELKFDYLKFCGIFNDEMMVYNEDENGNVVYNWNYVDKIFDFLKKIKVKPFISLGYMPEQLASKRQYIFFYRANVSYPKSIEKWNKLVEDFVKHLISRYSQEEVESWYIEIWNNPNLDGMYWYEGDEKYLYFYKNTYLAIKNISKNIKIGGPSVAANTGVENGKAFKEWTLKYIDYLFKNKIDLDFFSIHSYPILPNNNNDEVIFDKLRYKTFKGMNKCFLRDIDSLKEDIEFTKEILNKSPYKNTELIVSEWNAEPLMESSVNDTCFLAVNIIYNAIENIGRSNGLVYWSLSDIFEEYGTYQKIFHGSFGLLTYNGLKKASYNAYYLLNKLGNNIVAKDEGCFITKKSNSYQILLYNYAYFDELSRLKLGSKEKVSYKSTDSKEFSLKLIDIPQGNYKIRKTYLNENSGSIFDAWKKMGEPENIDDEVLELLKLKEKMDLYIEKREMLNEYNISEKLEIQTVVFIEIEKI